MNTRTLLAGLALVAFAGCAHVVHVPPGASLQVALARKPEVIRVPAPAASSLVADNAAPGSRAISIPDVEPGLPINDRIEAGPEAYARGVDLMANGKNAEAIAALEQAVQTDPNYAEAWHRLGVAYEKAGNAEKAREAFRHSQGAAPQGQ
jgi:tetratricopeptide (TPR) repeat protein